MSLATSHIRIARPTNNLQAIRLFYIDGLGFHELYSFKDHDGFDGLMVGHSGAAYHLEFTCKHGHDAGRAPTEDNLLVFYVPDRAAWVEVVTMMEQAGFDPVKPFNPYWAKKGHTFEDPDGYRVVVENSSWGKESEGGEKKKL